MFENFLMAFGEHKTVKERDQQVHRSPEPQFGPQCLPNGTAPPTEHSKKTAPAGLARDIQRIADGHLEQTAIGCERLRIFRNSKIGEDGKAKMLEEEGREGEGEGRARRHSRQSTAQLNGAT